MNILPSIYTASRVPVPRPVNTVMLRPITSPTVPAITPETAPILPPVRGPAILTTVKDGTTPSKKKGRPSKEDKRKAKIAKASDSIRELLESDPSKADVYNYFEARIEELNESDSD